MEGWVGKGCSVGAVVTTRIGSRPSLRKIAFVTCIFLAASVTTRTAGAILPVVDPSAVLQRGFNFASTLAHYSSTIAHYSSVVKQYAVDVAHYKSVMDHYAQQVVKLRGLANINLASIVMPPALAEITASDKKDLVEQACPGSKDKAGLGQLVRMFTPSLGASIRDQQQTVCRRIAELRIEKFNKTVRMIDRLRIFQQNADQLTVTLKELGGKQGDMEGFKGVVEANQAMLEVEMQGWKAQLEADDQVISYFEHQQGNLGRVALRGDPSFMGKVVHATTLRAAFKALNH